jgi:hypothetical protein
MPEDAALVAQPWKNLGRFVSESSFPLYSKYVKQYTLKQFPDAVTSAGQMSDETKSGTQWKDDELDAIVADYFAMLAADLSGEPYVKSRHSAALMARIGRSHRSVEFKHQNNSAVLDELGMPWIPGYKPKLNYQNAIFDAIDRYLTSHPAILEPVRRLLPSPPLSG